MSMNLHVEATRKATVKVKGRRKIIVDRVSFNLWQTPTEVTPELLTFPIEYQPRHIKALGFISSVHALQTDAAVLDARNRHVLGLQGLPGCDAYGEVLA